MGINQIWLPPLCSSHTVEGYFPDDYYDFNSEYGTEDQLFSLVEKCNENNIKCIADIVTWECIPGVCRDKFNFNGTLVNANDKDGFIEELIKYMNFLNETVGIKGYRLDYIKGLGETNVKNILQNLNNSELVIGELWEVMNYDNGTLSYDQHSHRQDIFNFIQNTNIDLCMFDFTMKGCLQEAFYKNDYNHIAYSDNQLKGLGTILPHNTYTFIDNHDTGSSQNHWPFPQNNLIEGYAFNIMHPGTPTIFIDHIHLKELETLINLYHSNSNDNVSIVTCEHNYYLSVCGDYVFELGQRRWFQGEIVFEYNNCRIFST
tara:strand:+ start:1912 stop:2862 length:951 start_codon:yes stop_codon:yes gene_type:complete